MARVRAPTIHLVRHGESTWHLQGRVQGQYAGPGEPVLTTKGEEQARAVGTFLAESGVEPTDVFCGSLVRQRESARLAAEAAGAEEEERRRAQQEKFEKLTPAEQARRKDLAKRRAQRKAQMTQAKRS